MTPKELEIHQRHFLKSKDKKELIEELSEQLPDRTIRELITPKSKVEWIKVGEHEELYAIDDVLTLWVSGEDYVPLLSFLRHNENFPWKAVTVDKGAIRFMSKGADVMRPGIIDIDPTIEEGDVVLVKDPIHGKVLSVGKAKFDAEEMKQKSNGKVIKCIHSLQDKIWDFSKTM